MSKVSVSILGCGWFGMPLGKLLVSKDYNVKGSTTSVDKLELIKSEGMRPYLIDLQSNEGSNEFWDADILVVTLPPRSTQKLTDQVTKRLKRQIEIHDYQQVLVISSISVYPDVHGVVSEADASYQSLSRSGISLLKYEDKLSQAAAGKEVILRFAGLCGPGRHPVKFLSGKKMPDGAAPVNLIHLEDCLSISLLIIERKIVGERFNACHPDHPVKSKFYTAAANQLGIIPPSFSTGSKHSKIVSSKKLIEILNYSFTDRLKHV